MDPDRQNVLVASLLPRPRLRAAGLVDRPLAIAVLLRNKNDAVAGSFLSPCKGEIPRDTDSPQEGTGFEPSVPREAAGILVISVLVRADFSACRESSK